MPTLRHMIDGRTMMGAAPPPKPPKPPSEGKDEAPGGQGGESGFQAPMGAKPAGSPTGSPAANHVSTHVQDPYSATKAITDRLNQAQMQYELEKHNANMMLEPVRQVVDGISQQHGLMTTKPLASQNVNNPDVQQGMDPTTGGVPQMGNQPGMGVTPGQMNQNRPSQVGSQPGMPPGGFPGQSVVPNKMGIPAPGMGVPASQAGVPGASIPGQKPPMPAGWQGPQPPPGGQFNPSAAKPNGAGQLPGAKGPGDPSVQNPIKKSQGKSGSSSGKSDSKGKVNIAVHADAKTPSMAPSPLAGSMGVAQLRSCDYGKKMKGYGTSEGASKAWDTRGRGKKEDDTHFGPGGVYKNPTVRKHGPADNYTPGLGTYNTVKSYPASKTAQKSDPNERFGYGVDEPSAKKQKWGEGVKSHPAWGFDAAKDRMKMKKMKGGLFKPKTR